MSLGYRKPITLASIYIPHSKNLNCNELRDGVRQLPKPIILMGDFNAHHEMWGNDRTDQRGKVVETRIIQEELNVLNNGAVTHISGTAIDLTIVSPELEADMQWTAIPTVLSSDHFPVLVSISTSRREFKHGHDIINYRRGNWKRYREDPH